MKENPGFFTVKDWQMTAQWRGGTNHSGSGPELSSCQHPEDTYEKDKLLPVMQDVVCMFNILAVSTERSSCIVYLHKC